MIILTHVYSILIPTNSVYVFANMINLHMIPVLQKKQKKTEHKSVRESIRIWYTASKNKSTVDGGLYICI